MTDFTLFITVYKVGYHFLLYLVVLLLLLLLLLLLQHFGWMSVVNELYHLDSNKIFPHFEQKKFSVLQTSSNFFFTICHILIKLHYAAKLLMFYGAESL